MSLLECVIILPLALIVAWCLQCSWCDKDKRLPAEHITVSITDGILFLLILGGVITLVKSIMG